MATMSDMFVKYWDTVYVEESIVTNKANLEKLHHNWTKTHKLSRLFR